MSDLSAVQVVMVVTGVFLVIVGLFGLVPLLWDWRAMGRRARAAVASTVPASAAAAVEPVAALSTAAGSSVAGVLEEMLAQTLSLREEVSALAADVRQLRLDLQQKRERKPRRKPAAIEVVQGAAVSRRAA